MRIRTFAAALAALAAITVAAEAQVPGGHPGGGGRRGMPVDFATMLLSPLPPDTMSRVVGLDSAQRKRYTKLYGHFTQAMRPPQGDSLRTLMERMRAARQDGDTARVRRYQAALRSFGTQWFRRRKAFDDSLHVLLTAEQRKLLDDWRAAHGWPRGPQPAQPAR